MALIGCVLLLIQMMRSDETAPIFADREAEEAADNVHGLWATLGWFASLLIASAIFGFILALAGFLLLFIRIRAGKSWGYAATYTAAGIAFICGMAWTLNRDFPPGLLQSYVDLPWPLT